MTTTLPALATTMKARLRPVVLVSAEPAADAALSSRNGGATAVDLLRTQARVRGLSVPVRVGDGVARVTELELRFVAAGAAAPVRPEAADARCREAMAEAAMAAAAMVGGGGLVGSSSTGDVLVGTRRICPSSGGGGGVGEAAAAAATAGRDPTAAATTALTSTTATAAPWFRAYAAEFDRLLAFCPQEALDLPVACVYVLPADVRDPVGHAEALLRGQPPVVAAAAEAAAPAAPPPPPTTTWCPTAAAIRQLLRDPAFPRHYVLLDDASAEAREAREAGGLSGGGAAADAARQARQARVRDNAASLRHRFGAPNVTVLRVNSRWAEAEAEEAGTAAAATAGAQPPSSPPGLPPEAFLAVRPPRLPAGSASAAPGAPGAVSCGCAGELYASSSSEQPQQERLGAALSAGDVSAARSVVAAIAAGTLLPRLEERLTRLDAAVTASRRGLGNRLRRFLKAGGASGSDGGDGAGGGGGGLFSPSASSSGQTQPQQQQQQQQHYAWDSPEWQMRQLGDLLSLLRCWPQAAAAYRLASADYLSAGQHAWYASAQEALAVCCVMASAAAAEQQQQQQQVGSGGGGGGGVASGAGSATSGFFSSLAAAAAGVSSANGTGDPGPSTPGGSAASSVHGGSAVAAAAPAAAAQQQHNPLAAALAQASAAASGASSAASGDPARYFQRAFEHYSRAAAAAAAAGGQDSQQPQQQQQQTLPAAARLFRMLATRSMLRLAAWHESQGKPALAAAALMRAHFDDENARAALLLERAAGLLLAPAAAGAGGGGAGPGRRPAPQRRRFAFHTVLAGLRFQAARQPALAAACYSRAQGVYDGAGWRFIDEHFHDALARRAAQAEQEAAAAADNGSSDAPTTANANAARLSAAADALAQAAALLECAHRPQAAQQARVDAFSAAAARWRELSAASGGAPGAAPGRPQAVAAVASLSASELDDEALARAMYALLVSPSLEAGGGGGGGEHEAAAAAAGSALPTPELLAAATVPLRRLAVLSRLSRASGLPIVEGLPVPRVSLGGAGGGAGGGGGLDGGGSGGGASASASAAAAAGWTRCSGLRCTDGTAAEAVPEGEWERLELAAAAAASAAAAAAPVPAPEQQPLAALSSGAAALAVGAAAAKRPAAAPAVAAWRGAPFSTVAAGEEIGVDVAFANPLAVGVTLTHVRLLCEFCPSSSSSSSAAPAPAPATATATTTATAARAPTPAEVDIPLTELALHPGERLVHRLLARPSAAAAGGWLRVVGVAWAFGGAAEGRALLLPPAQAAGAPPPPAAPPLRVKRMGDPPPHSRRLLFRVAPPMPRLVASLSAWAVGGAAEAVGGGGGNAEAAGAAATSPALLPLPPTVYSGELLRATLTVRNVGKTPARAVALAYESALAAEVDEDDGGRRGGGGGGGGGGASAAGPPPLALVLALHSGNASSSTSSGVLPLAEEAKGDALVPDPLEQGDSFAGAPLLSASAAAAAAATKLPPEVLALSSQSGGHLPRTAALAGIKGGSAGAADAASLLLQPGEAVSATLWLLAARPGAASIRLALYCEPSAAPAVGEEVLPCRLARAAWPLTALPLLRAAAPRARLAAAEAAGGGGGGAGAASPATPRGSVDVRLDVEAANVGARPALTALAVLPPLFDPEGGGGGLPSSASWALLPAAQALPTLPSGGAAVLRARLLPPGSDQQASSSSPLNSRLVRELLRAQRLQGQRWLRGQQQKQQQQMQQQLQQQHQRSRRALPVAAVPPAPTPPLRPPPTAGVDLALCWRLLSSAEEEGGGAAAPGHPLPAAARAGVLLLPDALASLRERPVQLSVAVAASAAGSAAAASAASAATATTVVPHDFASSPVCVVPLALRAANSGDRPCEVRILLGDGGDAAAAAAEARAAAASAWRCRLPPPQQQPAAPPPPPMPGADPYGTGPPALPVAPLPPPPAGPLVQAGLAPAPEVAWVGATRLLVSSGGDDKHSGRLLAPGAVAEVPLAVAVMRAGCHALPSYCVEWRPVGGAEEDQEDDNEDEGDEGGGAGGGVLVGPHLTLQVG
jgi:hypothetical protein